jgi:hypothetical protein
MGSASAVRDTSDTTSAPARSAASWAYLFFALIVAGVVIGHGGASFSSFQLSLAGWSLILHSCYYLRLYVGRKGLDFHLFCLIMRLLWPRTGTT